MHHRTGTQVAMVAVRGNDDGYMRPVIFASSRMVEHCFVTHYDETLADFGIKLEAFGVSGMAGT